MSRHARPAIFAGPNVLPFPRRTEARKAWTIKAAANGEAEVWIYGDIGMSWFDDGVTAKGFADELKALGKITTLNIYLNSPGGSVFEGVAIYNTLRRHAARKVVHIDGLAASIASVIAMAGDEIRIATNGLVMIHNPYGLAMGEADELRRMADALDKIKGAILDTYVLRTGGSADEIERQMDAETWFNAQEAVEAGFADSITEPVEMAAFAGLDVSAYRHPPEALKAAAAAPKPDPVPSADDTTERADGAPGEGRRPHPALASVEARLKRRGLSPAA
jgi:ATP-dependent Clp protease protease subunit